MVDDLFFYCIFELMFFFVNDKVDYSMEMCFVVFFFFYIGKQQVYVGFIVVGRASIVCRVNVWFVIQCIYFQFGIFRKIVDFVVFMNVLCFFRGVGGNGWVGFWQYFVVVDVFQFMDLNFVFQ